MGRKSASPHSPYIFSAFDAVDWFTLWSVEHLVCLRVAYADGCDKAAVSDALGMRTGCLYNAISQRFVAGLGFLLIKRL